MTTQDAKCSDCDTTGSDCSGIAGSSGKRLEKTQNNHRQDQKDENVEPWLQVVGIFFIFFNIWGIPMAFGSFQAFFTLHLLPDESASNISWIGTVQSGFLIALGIVSGPLFDLGYWRVLVLVGSFLTVFGMMMLSISRTYWQLFLAQAVCIGIGSGLLYIPSLGLLGTGFSKNRAISMGIATSGIALGGVVYTVAFLNLIDVVGYGWTMRILGFIALFTFILAAPMILRDRPKKSRVRSLFEIAAFKDTLFVIFTAAQFFLFVGYMVPAFYVPTFAQVALGTSQATSLYVLAAIQGASLVGRLAAGFLAQTCGIMLPWIFCTIASSALCFGWIAVHTLGHLIVFSVLYGLFSGALIALPPGIFPKICPEPEKMGSRMGISWAFVAVAMLIGSPIAGAAIDLDTKNFTGAQAWSGATLATGSLLQIITWLKLSKRYNTYRI